MECKELVLIFEANTRNMLQQKNILSKEVADKKMHRLALEIAESLTGDDAPVILIGVRKHGTVVAEKIAEYLKPFVASSLQTISVEFDKDHPSEIVLSAKPDFNDTNIIIVDDVCNSGKTLLYALKPLLDSYPRRIQTLVLIERMHKLFPVKPDFVGLSVATTMTDHIHVRVENGEVAGAFIE